MLVLNVFKSIDDMYRMSYYLGDIYFTRIDEPIKIKALPCYKESYLTADKKRITKK